MDRIFLLANCVATLVLGFGISAEGSVLFTATETSPAAITQTATLGNVFSFGYDDTQIHGSCSNCLSASGGNGSPLGDYGFSVVSGPFNYITDPAGDTQSAIPLDGTYFEHYSGYTTFDISATGLPTLLGGGSNIFGVSIWATPGSTTVTMEFDINGDGVNRATSDFVSVSGPLYLDVTGTTSDPITLTDLTPGQTPDFMTFTDPLAVDFTVTLSDTPYSPSSLTPPPPVSDVPEPGTAALFGMLVLGAGRLTRRGR